MSKFNEFAVEDELLRVNRGLNERWALLKLYLEASKEECLYSPHEIATFQDVIEKMNELEKKFLFD